MATTDEMAVFKWALGASWGVVLACFGWIWRTDRSVQALILKLEAAQETNETYRRDRERTEHDERQERNQWRAEMVSWIKEIAEEVTDLKNKEATRTGFEKAKERFQK